MLRVNTDEIEFDDDYVYRFKGEPFNGIGYELNESGTLLSEIAFQDGMKHGFSREWSRAGKIVIEHSYYKNIPHGSFRKWSETGVLLLEEDFEYGFCLRRRTWNDDGTLAEEILLENGGDQFKVLESIRATMAHGNGRKSDSP